MNCSKCGNKYSTKLIKVYVFKLRHCPKKGCKGKMFTYNDRKIHKCKKCGFEVKFEDQMTIGSMGVTMKGTSRNKKAAEAMARNGYEVTRVVVPEKYYCQRCLNTNRMINNMVQKETMRRKRINREIPEEEAKEINREAVRKAVLQKLQEQHKKEVKRRKQEMSEKEKSRKAKEVKKALLTTPFNTTPSKKKKSKKVDSAIEVITKSNFDQIVNNPLVLIDCWAEWCKPCLVVSPIVEEVAKDYTGKVVVGKLNVDENKELSNRFNIMGIPTLLIMSNGKEIDRIVGVKPKDVIEASLDKHLKKEKK